MKKNLKPFEYVTEEEANSIPDLSILFFFGKEKFEKDLERKRNIKQKSNSRGNK